MCFLFLPLCLPMKLTFPVQEVKFIKCVLPDFGAVDLEAGLHSSVESGGFREIASARLKPRCSCPGCTHHLRLFAVLSPLPVGRARQVPLHGFADG